MVGSTSITKIKPIETVYKGYRLENPVIRAKFRDIIQAKIRADAVSDISDTGLAKALGGTVMPMILTRYAISLRDAGELEVAQP